MDQTARIESGDATANPSTIPNPVVRYCRDAGIKDDA
jgi:hypothetical protein